MRALFIGGTGNISGAVSRMAVERGIDLFLFLAPLRQSEPPLAEYVPFVDYQLNNLIKVAHECGKPTGVVINFLATGQSWLAAAGLHTNGYSLARAVLARSGLALADPLPGGAGERMRVRRGRAEARAAGRLAGQGVPPFVPHARRVGVSHAGAGSRLSPQPAVCALQPDVSAGG